MYKYSGVVVIYNPSNEVYDNILQYYDCIDKLYVIDNSEVYNNILISKMKNMEKVEYKNFNGNHGISKALNYACNKSSEEGYDYILTMDQDSILSKESIEKMKEYIESNNDGLIGVFAPNYKVAFYNPKTTSIQYTTPAISECENIIKDYAMTSGSIIDINIYRKVGGFDENYFVGYVDIDYCIQIKLKGYKTIILGHSMLYQQVGNVIYKHMFHNILRPTNHNPIRYYYLIRNNFYFRKKYKKGKFRIKSLSYYLLIKYILKLLTSEKNKLAKIKMCFMGYQQFKQNKMGKYSNI